MINNSTHFTQLPQAPEGFVSNSRRIGESSEAWTMQYVSCPACNAAQKLNKFDNNHKASDFVCPACRERYQLKAHKNRFSGVINDGALSSMLEAFDKREVPSLFIMAYSADEWRVNGLVCLPGFLFPRSSIIARKPLGPNARRAGWQGCLFNLREVPKEMFVPIVVDGTLLPHDTIAAKFKALAPLREPSHSSGWTAEIFRLVNCQSGEFTNDDLYRHEGSLRALFPANNHVKDKIRQQLQVLRDLGYIVSDKRGKWRRTGVFTTVGKS